MTSFASFFTEITAQEAKKCLEVAEGFILFIGRPSCPYCRRFEPKLTQVAKDNQLTVYFVNSEAADSDIQDLSAVALEDWNRVLGLPIAQSVPPASLLD